MSRSNVKQQRRYMYRYMLLILILQCNVCQTRNQQRLYGYKYCNSEETENRDGNKFDCSALNLHQVPTFLPASTVELELQDNDIEHLENNSFGHLTNLKKLNLSKNNIQGLSASSFLNLPALEELDISFNNIRSIPCDTFHPLRNLKRLFILDRPVKRRFELGDCSFIGLQQLRHLELGTNYVVDIPDSTFRSLDNLRSLQMGLRQNREISTSWCLNLTMFKSLRKLVYLDLSNSAKTYICHPKSTSSQLNTINSAVKYLDISHSNLRAIGPTSFSSVSKPVTVNNSLEFIDSLVFDGFQNILTLNLSANRITRVQGAMFSQLRNLSHLDLSQNRINSIHPHAFQNLGNLVHLNISDNKINKLDPSSFVDLTSMKTLDISHNLLKHVKVDVFQSLVNLGSLNLSGNLIYSIDTHCFSAHSNLKYLDLSNNRLQRLHHRVFGSLSNLIRLDLASNELRRIPESTFQTLINIQHLSVSDNNFLSPMNLTVFEPLTQMERFELSCVANTEEYSCLRHLLQIRYGLGHWLCMFPRLRTVHWFDEVDPVYSTTFPSIDTSFIYIQLSQVSKNGCNVIKFISITFSPWLKIEPSQHPNPISKLLCETHIITLDLKVPVNAMPHCKTNTSFEVRNVMFNGYNDTLGAVFSCFSGVSVLYLNNSNPPLTSINDHTFIGMSNLQLLDISGNNLKQINNLAFEGLPNLTFVNLSHNDIRHMSRHTFSNLQSLRTLDLSNNRFFKQESIAYLQNVETLYLIAIKRFPSAMHIPNLRYLDVSMNDIGVIDITNHQLKVLRITSSPYTLSIRNISQLVEVLDMSNTASVIFEEREMFFPSLTLFTARVRATSPTHITAPSLSSLDLSYSNLNINDHKLFFHDVANLTFVNLTHTQYNHVLHNCNNTSTNCHVIFKDFLNVEVLDISHSSITSIYQFWFRGLRMLEYLDLSNNAIMSFENDTFLYNPNLKMIDFTFNELFTLDPTSFTSLHSLSFLFFDFNPVDCSCHMAEMLRWMTTTVSVKFTRDGTLPWETYTCNSPRDVRNHPLLTVDISDIFCNTTSNDLGLVLVEHNLVLIAPLCGMSVIVVIAFTTTVIVCKNKWNLARYAHRFISAHRKQFTLVHGEDGHQFQFDAFMCCSSQNEDWVENEFLPNLENEPPFFTFCISKRDFRVGYVVDNIENAVKRSRKVVFLVSAAFVKSEWCDYELKFADQYLIKARRDGLVFILLQDNAALKNMSSLLKIYINTSTCERWPVGGTEKEREAFWKRIRKHLHPKPIVDTVKETSI